MTTNNSANLDAIDVINSYEVLKPLLEPSNGLTSRSASYVVLCTIGTSKSCAKSAESSFSAIPSFLARFRKEGVTSTIPSGNLGAFN